MGTKHWGQVQVGKVRNEKAVQGRAQCLQQIHTLTLFWLMSPMYFCKNILVSAAALQNGGRSFYHGRWLAKVKVFHNGGSFGSLFNPWISLFLIKCL